MPHKKGTMRIFQLAILCFICVAKTYGQTANNSYGKIDVEITKQKRPKKIYAKVEIKESFPGGDSSWVQSIEKKISQSLKYRNGAKKGKYIVSVQFVVLKDSSLADIRCVNSPPNGFGMEQEVIRALKGRAVWQPAYFPSPVRPYRTSTVTSSSSN